MREIFGHWFGKCARRGRAQEVNRSQDTERNRGRRRRNDRAEFKNGKVRRERLAYDGRRDSGRTNFGASLVGTGARIDVRNERSSGLR